MRIVIASRLSQIGLALALVDELRARHGLAERDANAASVILDELITNSIRHGLAGAGDHEISVTVECADGELVVEVEDDGIAFDPTKAPAPQTQGTLAERKVGGLGIAFVRGEADSLEYERRAGRNRITARRRLSH